MACHSGMSLAESAPGTPGTSTNESHRTIERLYREVLAREPDAAGLVTYTKAFAEEGRDGEWLEKVLRESAERRELDRQQRVRVSNRRRLAVTAGLLGAALAFVGFRRRKAVSALWTAGGDLCRRFFLSSAPGSAQLAASRVGLLLLDAWALALAAATLAMAWCSRVPGPYWDDWGFIRFIVGAHDGTLSLSDWLAQHNDSRPVLWRLVLWLFVQTGRLSWTAVNLGPFVCLILLGVLLGLLVQVRFRGDPLAQRLGRLAVASTALVASQPENLWWGLQIIYYIPALALAAHLLAVMGGVSGWRLLLAGVAAALIAQMGYANGFLIWMLVLPWTGLRNWRRDLPWWLAHGLAMAVCVGLAVWCYQRSLIASPPDFSLRGLGAQGHYLLVWLGSPFSLGDVRVGQGLGIALILLGARALLRVLPGLWRDGVRHPAWPWAMFMLYALGTGIVIAHSRHAFGLPHALSSRYVAFSAFWTLGLLALELQARPGAPVSTRPLAIMAVTGVAVLATVMVPREMDRIRFEPGIGIDWRLRAWLTLNLEPVYGPHPDLNRLVPWGHETPGLYDQMVERVLCPPRGPGATARAQLRGELDSPPGSGSLDDVYVSGRRLAARGWAARGQPPGPFASVVVVARPDPTDTWHMLGVLPCGKARPDVAQRHRLPAWENSGFSDDLSAEMLTPGTYEVRAMAFDLARNEVRQLPGVFRVQRDAGGALEARPW